jgi:hypothetical protein
MLFGLLSSRFWLPVTQPHQKDAELLNESIHLSYALHISGYTAVVGL